ncbi:ribosome biogenesis GTP-binding protein YihA/YsxC [soil metagenome]
MTTRIIQPTFVTSLPKWNDTGLDPLPQICVAGRSNVGKSSLINAVVGQGIARTSSTPGRTQALVVFSVKARREEVTIPFHLVDLPGYGFAKVPLEMKQSWRPMMLSFFKGNSRLKGCLMLLDIRRTPSTDDMELLEMMGEEGVPVLPIITKIDKVPKTQRPRELKKIAAAIHVEASSLRVVSVHEKIGLEELAGDLFEAVVEDDRCSDQ